MKARSAEFLIRSLPAWGERQRDVLAVGLVGSHARGEATPDSDIDVIVISEAPQAYADDTSWTASFGQPDRTAIEHYGVLTSVRVFYADGPEVEFGFAGPGWAASPVDPGTAEVVAGGMRVLFEREPLLTPLVETAAKAAL